jgi:hypothetical protein
MTRTTISLYIFLGLYIIECQSQTNWNHNLDIFFFFYFRFKPNHVAWWFVETLCSPDESVEKNKCTSLRWKLEIRNKGSNSGYPECSALVYFVSYKTSHTQRSHMTQYIGFKLRKKNKRKPQIHFYNGKLLCCMRPFPYSAFFTSRISWMTSVPAINKSVTQMFCNVWLILSQNHFRSALLFSNFSLQLWKPNECREKDYLNNNGDDVQSCLLGYTAV